MTSAPRRRVVATSNWAPLKASSMPESSVVDLDADPHGYAWIWLSWKRIRTRNGDPDPGAWK